MVNGYSDVIPNDFREAAPVLDWFPSGDAFAVLARRRVRYIAVHWDMYRGSAGGDPPAAGPVCRESESPGGGRADDALRGGEIPVGIGGSADRDVGVCRFDA